MTNTDQLYFDGIISGDQSVIEEFFYRKMQNAIQYWNHRLWNGRMQFEELVSELYLYLVENDCRRLRLFKGESSLSTWVNKVAKNRFLAIRERLDVIPSSAEETESCLPTSGCYVQEDITAMMIDMHSAIAKIPHLRYAFVANRLYVDINDEATVCKVTRTSGSTWHNLKKHTREALMRGMDR